MCLFTIVTVCKNSDKTIKRTIESVLNQTYENYEYLIIDGQSTDKTIEIIKDYEPLFNGKMKYISEKDDGIYDAMNKGIAISSGQYIGILNSDDWYEKDALENVFHAVSGEKYQIIYGGISIWENNMLEEKLILYHNFINKRMICHPAIFVSRNVYLDFGLYSTKYSIVSDYEMLIRCYKNNLIQFTPIEKILTNFSKGGISTTLKGEKETLDLMKELGLIKRKQYFFKKIVLMCKTIVKY